MTSATKSTKSTTLTISESVRELQRSAIWIRRLLVSKDGRKPVLEGTKDENGHWRVTRASIDRYKAQVELREQKRLAQLESGSTYNYVRPRAMAIQMVRRGIVEVNFSKEQREVTNTVLDKLEQVWTAQYESRKAKRSK